MPGEIYIRLNSGFTKDLYGRWNFVFFTDILRRLTGRRLDWLQRGIEAERKRRSHEEEQLDKRLAFLAQFPPGSQGSATTVRSTTVLTNSQFVEDPNHEALRHTEDDTESFPPRNVLDKVVKRPVTSTSVSITVHGRGLRFITSGHNPRLDVKFARSAGEASPAAPPSGGRWCTRPSRAFCTYSKAEAMKCVRCGRERGSSASTASSSSSSSSASRASARSVPSYPSSVEPPATQTWNRLVETSEVAAGEDPPFAVAALPSLVPSVDDDSEDVAEGVLH